MGENTKIEWAHHTFNPWRGCTKVSAGCDHCYADTGSKRNPAVLGVWGKHGTRVVASAAMWKLPYKWNAAAEQAGERHRVFCASLADIFEGNETLPDGHYSAIREARERLGMRILDTPSLDWLLLTKRPQNVMHLAEQIWPMWDRNRDSLPPNVWIGTSVEDQKTADERIPHLLQIPAKVRFLSIEPLLGPVALPECTHDEKCRITAEGHSERPLCGIDWVIVGGESGGKARPMHPDWVRSIRDQCQAAGVPFFFKQWGNYAAGCQLPPETVNLALNHSVVMNSLGEITDIADDQGFDNNIRHFNVGKKQAGRLLDGREWNELPEATR